MNTRFLPLHWLAKLSLATALLSLSLEATQANQATHQKGKPVFAWKVTNPKTNQIAYLVGSIYLGKEEFYPLPAVIEKAFAASDALVVEVDITKLPLKQEDSIMMFFLQCCSVVVNITFLFLPNFAFLKYANMWQVSWINLVPYTFLFSSIFCFFIMIVIIIHSSYKKWDTETFNLLQDALQRINIKGYKKFQLIYLVSPKDLTQKLSEALQKEILGIAELGLERHFITSAKETDKTIIELEDIQTQQNMLAQLKPKSDFIVLQAFLRDFSIEESLHKKTLLAWQTGDTALLYEVMQDKKKRIINYDKLLFIERNTAMTEKIKVFLQGDKTIFVLVGAMHYVGETSILALLKKDGYIIEQLYN